MPPDTGFVEVLAPAGADVTNLVLNPSLELGTTGYTASSCTIAPDATNQKRGVYALKVTPAANACYVRYDKDGATGIVMVNGTTYYFTVDLLATAGLVFAIVIANTSDASLATLNVTATGFWQRVSVTWTENVGATRRLIVNHNTNVNRDPFWLDGWMCQSNALNQSYIDGDQAGCYWNAAPHASTSVGLGQSRDVGIWTNLDTFETGVEGWAGLGMPPVKPVLIPYGLPDGSNYQRTKALQRPFTLSLYTGGINWPVPINSLLLMHKYRRMLIDSFKPDAVSQPAPVWFRFGADPVNFGFQRPLKIQAVYDHGDELTYIASPTGGGGVNNLGAPGFVTEDQITFVAPNPYLQEDGNAGFAFTALNVASAGNAIDIAYAPNKAQWNNIGTGISGTGTRHVYALLYNPFDGRFYIAHDGTGINGVAGTSGVCAYDPVLGTIVALGGGALVSGTAKVTALALAPNGDVWAGGTQVSSFNSVANTQNIARWSLASGVWQSVGPTGTSGLLDQVSGITIAADGTAFVTGTFTNIGGNAVKNIAHRTPAGTWTAIGTGLSVSGNAILLGADQATVYVSGGGNLNGTTGTGFYTYNKTTAVITGYAGTGSGLTVAAFALAPNGSVYIGGIFASLAGTTCLNIGSFNGTQVSPLSSGLGPAIGEVFGLFSDLTTGLLYACGTFSTAGGIPVQNSFAIWNQSAWISPDVILPGGWAFAYASDGKGNRLIGFTNIGTAGPVTSGAFQTLSNPASATGRPTFTFTGPGTLYQLRNVTTGDLIAFNLTLAAGEIATLTLSALGSSFVSNFRGNILGAVLPGSNLSTFRLVPATASAAGVNVLEVLMTGTTGASLATVQWILQHWSLDSGDQN